MRIGAHLSAADGLTAAGKQAGQIGANTFQYFSRNPRGGSVRREDPADLEGFAALCAAGALTPPLAHAPYTMNPASSNPKVRAFAAQALGEDLDRLERVSGAVYNLHPGSHTGQGVAAGTALCAQMLAKALEARPAVRVTLETMAGKGSELGGDFAGLASIIEGAGSPPGLGVCLDTCHVFDAGYDLRGALEPVLEEFDRTVGLSRLFAVHLNDSKNPLGSRKDRHEKIGCGSLGLDTFAAVINHPSLRRLPFYLETPCTLEGYAEEIALLKSLRSEP